MSIQYNKSFIYIYRIERIGYDIYYTTVKTTFMYFHNEDLYFFSPRGNMEINP